MLPLGKQQEILSHPSTSGPEEPKGAVKKFPCEADEKPTVFERARIYPCHKFR